LPCAFALLGSRANADDFSRGFAAASAVASVLSFAGAIIALWLPPRRAIALNKL
jgi:hypothetical protein